MFELIFRMTALCCAIYLAFSIFGLVAPLLATMIWAAYQEDKKFNEENKESE